MARYEYVEGSSSKFWEIDQKGSSVTTRWGRIGSTGQTKVESFKTADKAKAAAEKQTESKVKKGYVAAGKKVKAAPKPSNGKAAKAKKAAPAEPEAEASAEPEPGFMRFEMVEGGSSKFWAIKREDSSVTVKFGKIGTAGSEKTKKHEYASSARWDASKQISEKVSKGYARVFGAVRPIRSDDQEEAIYDAIDDSQAFEVYADWLQSKGDPRGELVTLEAAMGRGKSAKLAKARDAWIAKYPGYYMPDRFASLIAEKPKEKKGYYAERGKRRINRLELKNGFARTARISCGLEGKESIEELTLELLTHPASRFLHTLEYGPMSDEHSYGGVVKTLVSIGLPALRSLWLAEFDMEDSELSWSSAGDMGPLWAKVPRLEHLRIRSGSVSLGKIVLPNLRTFVLETGGLDKASVKAIASASWPEIESLEVWFGSSNYGAGGTVKDILPILEGKGLRKLKRLGLKNAEFTDEICDALPSAKILKQLTSLDLSMGSMGDEGAKVLQGHAKAFAHLELDVDDNYLTSEGKKLLAKVSKKVTFGNQREPYDWDEERRRYASVGE